MAELKDFNFMRDRGVKSLEKKETLELLEKWSLKDTLRITNFRFDTPIKDYEDEVFLKAFFSQPTVLSDLQILKSVNGTWGSIENNSQDPLDVVHEKLNCCFTSMEFFDRLYDSGAIRSNGAITGCLPEYLDGFAINQELQKILLMEDSDNYDVFEEEERKELLFKLFSLLVIGGPLNQYEDNVEPYFEIVKSLYKDLVTVTRDPDSNKLIVQTRVFLIKKVGDTELFPQEHFQNYAIVAVTPAKRTVSVVYNAWLG